MKGRPPDPSRKRRGTGNRPAAGEQKAIAATALPPAPALANAEPPAGLPPAGAAAWRLAVAEMGANRQLRASDLVLVKAWAEAVQVHEDASAAIHKYGVLVEGSMGAPVANPMIRVQKDAAGTIRQLSEVLGLNPLARIRAGIMEIAGQSMLFDLRERLVNRIVDG